MVERILAELRFKGSRDYHHSTDLYMAVIDLLRRDFGILEPQRIRMKFPRFLRRQPLAKISILPLSLKHPPAAADIGLEVRGRAGDRHFQITLEDSPNVVISRYAFDEAVLATCSEISSHSALLTGRCGYNTIEYIVILTKYLHQKRFPPRQGQWVVARLDLERVVSPEDENGLHIEFKDQIGDGFTCCEILQSNSRLGEIYFSWVEKS